MCLQINEVTAIRVLFSTNRSYSMRTYFLSANDIWKILVAVLCLAVCMYALVPEVRHQLNVFRTESWPRVCGTVQRGEVLHSGAGKYLFLPFRSLLGYSYKVDSRPYWGFFALPAEDMDVAEKLQKQAEGKTVTVKYDPRNPENSLLEDEELCEHRVTQNPTWLS